MLIRTFVYGILMWTVTIYAFRHGGWSERLAAAGLVLASYLSLLLRSTSAVYQHFEISVFLVDLTFFMLLLAISLKSHRFWPMWLAALQAISLLAHLLPYMPRMDPYLYYNAVALWSYPMWMLIAFATRQHAKGKTQRT